MISDFIKQYGISAFLILLACALGIFNIGLLGYEVQSITLFVFIAVVYMMFHVPTLWEIIWNAIEKGWNYLFGKKEWTKTPSYLF